jgi:hypothetical protein
MALAILEIREVQTSCAHLNSLNQLLRFPTVIDRFPDRRLRWGKNISSIDYLKHFWNAGTTFISQ